MEQKANFVYKELCEISVRKSDALPFLVSYFKILRDNKLIQIPYSSLFLDLLNFVDYR